jgi:phage shock protein A
MRRTAGFEDDGAMLDRVIEEMRRQLYEAKKQVCVAMVDERALRRHADRHAAHAASWESRAMLAVRAGDDALARAALLRKAEEDELAVTYEGQWLDQKRSVDSLRTALGALERRIDDASRQRRLLAARMSRANAQRTIAVALANMHGASAWSPLERLESRVVQIEAEVDAAADVGELSLEAEFAALEARMRVDEELAALKRGLAGGQAKKALPPGLSD